jgi:hypothetical protein
MKIVVTDTTPTGTETGRLLLEDVPAAVTLRDVIRHRVREEVARYNAGPGVRFNGLVQPTDAECTANGYELRRPRRLDWQAQAAVALDSFQHNGFFVFVGDRQVTDLDEQLTLVETDEVSFVRLVPLVGG